MPSATVVPEFTFIDLFAGIGGFRVAMEAAGGRCVMTSEADRWARRTYETFFGESQALVGDIREVDPRTVPEHDILCGGFPCQPFSSGGLATKAQLGQAHGFDDPAQGTLFFNIKEILRLKQPRGFVLENVRNLKSHDRGRTWKVIERALEEVGYVITERILDSSTVVPQHRERVFIVGLRRDIFHESQTNREFWNDVEGELRVEADRQRDRYGVARNAPWPTVGAILQPVRQVDPRFILTPRMWAWLRAHRAKHEGKGHGFGYSVVTSASKRTRTLSARYHKDGSEALVSQAGLPRPRRLTPLECLRLQGFPEEFETWFDGSSAQPVSDTQAYRQFGNAVTVPVAAALARVLAHRLSLSR